MLHVFGNLLLDSEKPVFQHFKSLIFIELYI